MDELQKKIKTFKESLPDHVRLIAVSKTKPADAIRTAYEIGQLDFGENKIQEMTEKFELLPKDIRWHMIGHVQTNKVKYMAPYVYIIHAVDSLKLLKEINKQAKKNNRTIKCLLQLKIAEEQQKFGLDKNEISEILSSDILKQLKYVKILGLMGMATFTSNQEQLKKEFENIYSFYKELKMKYDFIDELSIGMSGDYKIALKFGSTMVRIGSSIFGER